MRVVSLLLLVFLFSGCTAHVANPKEFIGVEKVVVLRVVEEINQNPSIMGRTLCSETHCEVEIRADQYPNCFTHEIRHVFEGAWHGEYRNKVHCDRK